MKFNISSYFRPFKLSQSKLVVFSNPSSNGVSNIACTTEHSGTIALLGLPFFETYSMENFKLLKSKFVIKYSGKNKPFGYKLYE